MKSAKELAVLAKVLASFSKPVRKGGGTMSSVATAQELTRELGSILAPEMPAKVKYDRIYRKLSAFLPGVSRRRIRALHNGEVRRVDFDEMRALQEARAEEELKRARREIAAAANVLAAHHAKAGASLDSDTMLALGKLMGAVDLPRDDEGAAR